MRVLVCLAALLIPAAAAAAEPRNALDIYVVDVEGGTRRCSSRLQGNWSSSTPATPAISRQNATSSRIMEAIRDARLGQIDHLILTHYHGDHFGGMAELAKQIPIREFIDHGPNMQPGAGADF